MIITNQSAQRESLIKRAARLEAENAAATAARAATPTKLEQEAASLREQLARLTETAASETAKLAALQREQAASMDLEEQARLAGPIRDARVRVGLADANVEKFQVTHSAVLVADDNRRDNAKHDETEEKLRSLSLLPQRDQIRGLFSEFIGELTETVVEMRTAHAAHERLANEARQMATHLHRPFSFGPGDLGQIISDLGVELAGSLGLPGLSLRLGSFSSSEETLSLTVNIPLPKKESK